MRPTLAIDPGASGGFAWTDSSGKIHCQPMPETEGDVIAFIRSRSCDGCAVVLEQVVGFIPMAGAGAMFSFGENFGGIKFTVQAFNMPLTLVRPQAWQKALSLGTKKDYGKDWKNHLKERAQQLFPEVENITLKTADALLILHYAQNL